MLLVTLWPSVGDSPPDFGIEGGGGSVSALLGMGQLFSWAPRDFLLGAVQEERKRLLSVQTGQYSVSQYGQGMGFSLQQDEGKRTSSLIPPMVLESISPFAMVRSHRRAGDGAIYKLRVSCLEVAGGLFLSSTTRKWPIVYT